MIIVDIAKMIGFICIFSNSQFWIFKCFTCHSLPHKNITKRIYFFLSFYSGKFATVKRCVKNVPPTGGATSSGGGGVTCQEVAAKIIRKSRSTRFGQKIEDIELEIAILTELQHDNIIRLMDVFEDVTQVVLVFEL